MSKSSALTSGLVGGITTMLTRSAVRKAMYAKDGAPRLPRRAQQQQGIGTMLMWAVAAGIILAVADVLLDQRMRSGDD